MIFPKHLQVEIVAGYCPSRCIMCPIDKSPRKQIMQDAEFQIILKRFQPYLEHLEYTTLHGLGEPLLDKNITNKIKLAKQMGFPSIGIATVGVNLTQELSSALIQSGLDTIIFSVDGFKKETHESIRKGTDFEKTLENIKSFIQERNKSGKTKIIVRMIRQDLNRDEWSDYQEFWLGRLSSDFGDEVGVFDVVKFSDSDSEFANRIASLSASTNLICSYLFERFYVYVDGRIAFCCNESGELKNWFDLGSVLHEDPIEIFNRGKFLEYRQAMQAGNISTLPHCRNCSVILSALESNYLKCERGA